MIGVAVAGRVARLWVGLAVTLMAGVRPHFAHRLASDSQHTQNSPGLPRSAGQADEDPLDQLRQQVAETEVSRLYPVRNALSCPARDHLIVLDTRVLNLLTDSCETARGRTSGPKSASGP